MVEEGEDEADEVEENSAIVLSDDRSIFFHLFMVAVDL